MTGRWPASRSLSTTWEPMKPEPPVTSTRMALVITGASMPDRSESSQRRARPARYGPGLTSGCTTLRRGCGGRFDASREQRLAGDHEALDLRRALVELHDLRVAHQLLHRVV